MNKGEGKVCEVGCMLSKKRRREGDWKAERRGRGVGDGRKMR